MVGTGIDVAGPPLGGERDVISEDAFVHVMYIPERRPDMVSHHGVASARYIVGALSHTVLQVVTYDAHKDMHIEIEHKLSVLI